MLRMLHIFNNFLGNPVQLVKSNMKNIARKTALNIKYKNKYSKKNSIKYRYVWFN